MLIDYVSLFSDAKVPERASSGAVGYDVYAYHELDKISREECGKLPRKIWPGESALFGIGVAIAVPFPVKCQVLPRSGLASKHDIELGNAPGTIDPDYRGEASILLRNRGENAFTIEKGMRIAQFTFDEVKIPVFREVRTLPPTSRASGGFGSTGLGTISLGDREYREEQAKWDRHFMRIAVSGSLLSNCLRGAERDERGAYKKDANGLYCGACRRFGCVIVQGRNPIAQGFNYRTSECSEEKGCVREVENIPTGTSNDRGCMHAEQSAIQNHAQTGGTSLVGATLYVNAEPCKMCAKLILGCGIGAVVVPKGVFPTNGLLLLLEAGIEVRFVET